MILVLFFVQIKNQTRAPSGILNPTEHCIMYQIKMMEKIGFSSHLIIIRFVTHCFCRSSRSSIQSFTFVTHVFLYIQ